MKSDMKLGTKLSLGFGGMVVIALVLGGSSYYSATRNDQTLTGITGKSMPAVEAMMNLGQQANVIDPVQIATRRARPAPQSPHLRGCATARI